MRNIDLPDCFDILHEDAPQSVLDHYAFLIDTTIDGRLRGYDGPAKVLSGTPREIQSALKQGLQDALSFEMEGEMIVQPYVEDDAACLMICNGDGIERTWQDGDKRLPEGRHTVTLTFPGSVELEPVYMSASDIMIEHEGETWRFTLPAGECCLVKTNRPSWTR